MPNTAISRLNARLAARSISTDPSVLLEDAQIPIIESDRRMIIIHCNAATTSVFGYSPEELVGQRVNILMQPEDSHRHDGYIKNFQSTGVKKILATVGRTVVGRHKDGTALTLQLTTTKTSTGYAAVFVNMTSQVETERRALAAERSSEAERSMKEFLAHEVRNPLSVAVAALRFASSSVDSGKGVAPGVSADLDMVSRSLEYIDDLLTGMLDLSKIKAGKIRLRPKCCSLVGDVLKPVVQMLGRGNSSGLGGGDNGGGSPLSPSQGPVLFVEEAVLKGDPLWVEIDALRLKQVFVNLTKNALKFVPTGFVRLGAKRMSEGNCVEIYVEDSGPGIPVNKAEAIFDKFSQLHPSDKGTGIGLALCRDIAEAMGGSVKVDTTYSSKSTEFGPGSRFVVSLPLQEMEPMMLVTEYDAQTAGGTERARSRGDALVLDDGKAAAMRNSPEGTSSDQQREIESGDIEHLSSSISSVLRGAYRVLVVSNNAACRDNIVLFLDNINEGKWRLETSSFEDNTIRAAVMAISSPIDIVVLHHPESQALVASKIAVMQDLIQQQEDEVMKGLRGGVENGGGCGGGGGRSKHTTWRKKPFVTVVMVDKSFSDDNGNGDASWRSVGADVVWQPHTHPPPLLGSKETLSLLSALPLPYAWRVLAVEDLSVVRRMLVRTLKVALGPGCVVVEASNSRKAVAALKASFKDDEEGAAMAFDLIVLDEHLDSSSTAEKCLVRSPSSSSSSSSGGSLSSNEKEDEWGEEEGEEIDNLQGSELALLARGKGSRAIIAGFSGDEMAAAHYAAGCDLSWRKTVDAATMRDDLLRCLHTERKTGSE